MSTNLGDLLRARGFAATAREEPAEAATTPSPPDTITFGPKVVVRISRKGRGGKTVTELAGVTEGHKALSKKLKKAMGIGVKVEGDILVLQGDQRDRLIPWLEGEGARRIVRG